jgi:hypothetical protein
MNTIDRYIELYLNAKFVMDIIQDHDRNDEVRSDILKSVTLDEIMQIDKLIDDLESAGIKLLIKKNAN